MSAKLKVYMNVYIGFVLLGTIKLKVLLYSKYISPRRLPFTNLSPTLFSYELKIVNTKNGLNFVPILLCNKLIIK